MQDGRGERESAPCDTLGETHESTPAVQGCGARISPTTRGAGSAASREEFVFEPGALVARRYRVERFLARGAMGEVYKALDLEFDTPVALKVIRGERAYDENALRRFKREVALCRRVTHPNVGRIFDVSYHDGRGGRPLIFLTMELILGESLAARIARGPVTGVDARAVAAQMAVALDAAHEVGVVHRDFKSANVMLVPANGGELPIRAVVTDFGLARAVGDDHPHGSLSEGVRLLGSPSYMAPEQVRGETAGPRADIYAFGVVLFEMCTGALPFTGETALATALKRLSEDPATPRALAPDLAPGWEDAILQCLERDPERRPARATEVITMLDASLGGTAPKGRSTAAGDAAMIDLDGIAASLPDAPAIARRYREGAALLWQGRLAASSEHFTAVVDAAPDCSVAHGALSLALARIDPERAQAAAARALDLSLALRVEEQLLIGAFAAEAMEGPPRRVSAWRKLCQQYPGNAFYNLRLMQALLEQGALDDARHVLGRLRSLPALRRDDLRLDLAEARLLGDLASTRKLAASVADRARRVDWKELAAEARRLEAHSLVNLFQFEEAIAALLDARALSEAVRDRWGVGEALQQLVLIKFHLGELSAAERLLDEIDREGAPHPATTAERLAMRARLLVSAGRREAAKPLLERCAQLERRLADPPTLSRLISAMVLHAQGALSASRLLLESQVIPRLRARRMQAILVWALHELGLLAIEQDELLQARISLQEALDIRRTFANRPGATHVEVSLAALLLAEGRTEEAAEHAGRSSVELAQTSRFDLAALATSIRANALLEMGLVRAARTDIDEAMGRAGATEAPHVRHTVLIATARVRARSAQPMEINEARRLLENVLESARRVHAYHDILCARLAMSELAVFAGDRSSLPALIADARAHGYALIVRKATALHERFP